MLMFVKVSKFLLIIHITQFFTLISNALLTYQNLPLFIAILPFSATLLPQVFITI